MDEVQGVDVSYEDQSYVGGESPSEYTTRIEREDAVDEAIAKFKDPIEKDIINFLMEELTLTEISKKYHISMSKLCRKKEKVVKELQILLRKYK